MTSAPFTSDGHDTDDHPDVADISALSEGLLPPARSSEVRTHLSDCPLCADVLASLEEIRDALGTLPGPPRMPADVAGRIDAALAAEAMLDADGQNGSLVSRETREGGAVDSDGTAGIDGTVDETGSEQEHSGRRLRAARAIRTTPVSRETGASRETRTDTSSAQSSAADRSRPAPGRPPGHPSGSTGPGRDAPSDRHPARATRRRRWRTPLLAGASAVALLGIGGLVTESLTASPSGTDRTTSAHADSGRTGGTEPSTAGGDRNDAALQKHVQRLLSKDTAVGERSDHGDQNGSGATARSAPATPTAPDSPGLRSKQSPPNPMAGGTTSVPSCIRKGIDRTESPLAVDERTTYKGSHGYLVVLPHDGRGRQQVDAYLVDPSCVNSDAGGSPAKVLVKRTYPRR